MNKIAFFIISLIAFFIVIYLVCGIWFRGKRSTYLKLFFAMGIVVSIWTLFNGINVLLSEELYQIIYPYVMLSACILPYGLLRYILCFTESKYAKSRLITWIFTILCSLDIAVLLTNPWHHEFISGYDGIRPLGGSWFLMHAIISYIPILITLIILFRYVIKNVRKKPQLIFIGLAVLMPIISNVLYTFNVFDLGVDITPFVFLLMFAAFTIYSINLKLFDVKEMAHSNIFTTLSDAFLVVNNSGYVTEANPSFTNAFPDFSLDFDKTSAEDVACFLQSITSQRYPENVFTALSYPTQEIQGAEITVLNDGELRNYVITKNILNERGQYAGFIITMSDISNYRQMIDEINEKNAVLTELKDLAETASKAKSDFLSNMSHEIRTPMNAVIGMVELTKKTKDPEKISQYMDKIGAASRHLLGIIKDILDMSKIESNKFVLNNEQFAFANMIQNIISIESTLIDKKKQRLKLTIDDGIPKIITADELRLSQVISNLLSNAIKFTPEEGHIELSAELLSRDDLSAKLQFYVSDDGIGIEEEKQVSLFNAFEQADLSISRQFGGTGLGLAISQKIVELMGGHISVESVLGKGSTFTFEICVDVPLEHTEGDFTASNLDDEALEYISYDFSGCTALLAEDVEINREIILALMEDTGIQIDCAENGQTALDMYIVNPERYDIIFMDIQMPILDGYSASQKIRELSFPHAKTVPIIAMTANAFAGDIEKSKEYGMDDHIAKPIDVDTLFQKTDELIKMRKSKT